MDKYSNLAALLALSRVVALLGLLCLVMLGFAGCTVVPAKMMGPTYERDWQLQERQVIPQTCPAPWVNEHKFYQLNLGV